MRSSVGQCRNIRFRQLYASHVIITSEYCKLFIERVRINFSGAGKVCLDHWMRQLTRDTKNDVTCLQTSSLICCTDKFRLTLGVGRHTKLIVKENNRISLKKSTIFPNYR